MVYRTTLSAPVFGLRREIDRLFEDTFGVLKQRTFCKQKRTEFFETLKYNYVFALKGVTRLAPLQFFGQRTAKNDCSQLLKLFLPLGFLQIVANLRIHFVDVPRLFRG